MRRAPILVALACATASVAGVATATVVSDEVSSPSTPAADLRAAPGTASVGARTRDPDGGPDWATRIYRSLGGNQCVEVGRTAGRSFGRADRRGEIEAQQPGEQGVCAGTSESPLQVSINRYASPQRTVVFGRASDRVARIVITRSGDKVDVPIGPAGTIVFVATGVLEPADLPITAYLDDGSIHEEDWR